MKKPLLIYQLVVIVIFGFGLSNCKKDTVKDSDYREKYLGIWEFNVYYYDKNPWKNTETWDTILYQGLISAGTKYNEIIVQYAEKENLILTVDVNGSIPNSFIPPSSSSGVFEDEFNFHCNYVRKPNMETHGLEIHGEKVGNPNFHMPPIVTSYQAKGISTKGAQLFGEVGTANLPFNVLFEYGISKDYGDSVFAKLTPMASRNQNANCYISGLIPGALYHYRIKSTNSVGKRYGVDYTFTTKTPTESVFDIEGNVYKTTPIDDQVWMAENLKTTKFQNGDPIPINLDISNELSPKYQWIYDGIDSNLAAYGRLYTWFAVTDSRNICPTGWHVPSSSEVHTLQQSIWDGGGLKEAGFSHWNAPNTGANNGSGFTALPSGSRSFTGEFSGLGFYTYFWTTSGNSSIAYHFNLTYDGWTFYIYSSDPKTAYSVRCIKD